MARKSDKTDKPPKLGDPGLYINRELSWLEFNHRVLQEGADESVPLLERLKFLAIVSSNLDEFFMIRAAGLRQQRDADVRGGDISGMSPAEQLAAISERVHRMVRDQDRAIDRVLARLAENGIALLGIDELSDAQRQFAAGTFGAEITPALTPLAIGDRSAAPLLPGLTLYVALELATEKRDVAGAEPETNDLAVIPVPEGLPRFLTLPAEQGLQLVCIEDVIAAHAGLLFAGRQVAGRAVFRITRDADVAVQSDDASDLLQAMQEAVVARRRRQVVRLEISAGADAALRDRLTEWLAVEPDDVYEIASVPDAAALMEIATRPGFDSLKYDDWPPQRPRDLADAEDVFQAARERDVLLSHPYEAFEPVVEMVRRAAADPNVLAIKQTLYRTSGDSPIVDALIAAAGRGKQVTVLVELKARFDEARNVNWARRLEDAGCYVIYGIAGYKTHAKALLIVRREAHRIRRYLHMGTGNYNDRTAKLYSDVGMITTDPDLTADAAAFFNLLTGYSQPVGWKRLSIAPTGLRDRTIELIEREIQASTPDRPGLILAKMNSLQDRRVIEALYRASRAGVTVRLNVRGICCLRPGVEGVSERIEVVSIIDRFLEHARIFYFRNGGHEEVYLSSADWMTRNLDKRLELLFPVPDGDCRRRLIDMLNVYFADNVKARRLLTDGSYRRVEASGPPVRAQQELYRRAVEAGPSEGERGVAFRPLTRPRDEDQRGK